MPKNAKSELDDLPMASAKPSAIREAAKQKRLATQAERARIKERQHRDADQQMKMQRYRDEIAAIKKNQKSGNDTETEGRKQTTSQQAKNVTEKALSMEVTASRERAVLGYTISDVSSDFPADEDVSIDGTSLDEDFNFESNKNKFNHLSSPKSHGRKVVHEMNKSFRAMDLTTANADEKSKKSVPRVPVSISAMGVSVEPPRQREYTADSDGRLRKAPVRSSSGKLFTRKAPIRQSSNLVPEMRRRPMQRDLLFDDDQVKLAKERGNTQAYRGTTSDYRRGSISNLNKKKLCDKQEKEKEEIMEQRKKLDEAEKAFDKGHNLCWGESHDSASACKTQLRMPCIIAINCLSSQQSHFYSG